MADNPQDIALGTLGAVAAACYAPGLLLAYGGLAVMINWLSNLPEPTWVEKVAPEPVEIVKPKPKKKEVS